jgi:hypothetical protein
MNSMLSKIIGAGIFFLFIVITGFWVRSSGKPPGTFPLTVHKLIGVAAVVYLVINIVRINKTTALSSTELAAAIIAGAFFLVTIISGGLNSIEKPMPQPVVLMHKISPYLTILSTGAALFLLYRR